MQCFCTGQQQLSEKALKWVRTEHYLNVHLSHAVPKVKHILFPFPNISSRVQNIGRDSAQNQNETLRWSNTTIYINTC